MATTQMLSFVALLSLMGHALTLTFRGDGGWMGWADEDEDKPGLFWSSERFGQSGDGESRPWFPE